LGFPNWSDLLGRIAKHPEINAANLTKEKESTTYRSQILFQHYRARRFAKVPPKEHGSLSLEYEIEVGWKKIVHQCLYENVPDISNSDFYLQEFLPIVRKSPLTINYNFDDSVQRMLLLRRSQDEKKVSRGYITVWSASVQIEAKEGVIYHPNGFLPRKLSEQ